jgi:hypothetical protein
MLPSGRAVEITGALGDSDALGLRADSAAEMEKRRFTLDGAAVATCSWAFCGVCCFSFESDDDGDALSDEEKLLRRCITNRELSLMLAACAARAAMVRGWLESKYTFSRGRTQRRHLPRVVYTRM